MTTLLDPKAYPAEQLAALYARRWRLELCLRDIKTSLGMEHLRCQSPAMAQKAGEAALYDGEPAVAEMVTRLRGNRDFALAALASMPRVTVPRPDGAFYLFPRIDGLRDSFEFCRRLLVEKKVGLAPGVAFGAGGEGFVRICYAADRTVLEPALCLLDEFLRAR